MQVEVPVDAVGRREPGALKSFLAGGVGGMCVVLTGHPLDTIKVRYGRLSSVCREKLCCLKRGLKQVTGESHHFRGVSSLQGSLITSG